MIHPYTTHLYAQALSHLGRELYIPEWNTSILIRQIAPGFEDATGIYPITILDKNADIETGLQRLRQHQLVSVVLVLDDFHRPTLEKLNKHFTLVKPFKTHYLFRPQQGNIIYDKHHRYELRQALKNVRVGVLNLQQHMEEWIKLYSNLITHKGISGFHEFPTEYHIALGKLAGVTAIGAWQNDQLVSCHIWISDGNYAYSHLAASSAQGYACRAGYAVNDASLQHFINAEIINFGGGAGHEDKEDDGLARFKRGFSNDTAMSYICGAILDEHRYRDLVQQRKVHNQTAFFPAYRAPKSTEVEI